mgnify:CR=1 FL=1
MSEIKKTLEVNRLLDIYGKILTKKQYEIMSDYYYCDLSLSEISELRNISRTAVSDTIKNAMKKLDKIEKSLGICRVFDKNRANNNEALLDKMEEEIKNGIWVVNRKI